MAPDTLPGRPVSVVGEDEEPDEVDVFSFAHPNPQPENAVARHQASRHLHQITTRQASDTLQVTVNTLNKAVIFKKEMNMT